MKKYSRLVELLRQSYNLTLTEAEGAIRGAEAEAVSRCGGRRAVIERAFHGRQFAASSKLRRQYPKARDVTMYCIDKGYTGKRRVLVHDGVVVSHGRVDWHVFGARLPR